MCRAYPGQVTCKSAGCTLPINVVNGIRHSFCSIRCARACGENPRVNNEKVAPPAYDPVGYNVELKRVESGTTTSTFASRYASPPLTECASGSDTEAEK